MLSKCSCEFIKIHVSIYKTTIVSHVNYLKVKWCIRSITELYKIAFSSLSISQLLAQKYKLPLLILLMKYSRKKN